MPFLFKNHLINKYTWDLGSTYTYQLAGHATVGGAAATAGCSAASAAGATAAIHPLAQPANVLQFANEIGQRSIGLC